MITFDRCEQISDATDVNLYINRDDVYARQTEFGYIREFHCIDDNVIAEHLLGIQTIGTYQITLDNTVTWLCIDVDCHDDESEVEAKVKACEIMFRLEHHKIPYVVEASGSNNSYHFWVFLKRVDASQAYWWGREILDGITVEIYPKQPELSPDKQFGNLVKLPFGINNKTGVRSVIVYKSRDLYSIDISSYDYSDFQEHLESQRQCVGSSGTLPSTLRPCMKACAEGKVTMCGTGGHVLRCALVPELRIVADWNQDEVTMVFKHQPDFDWETTKYQVNSVWMYNRFTCAKLQRDAFDLIGMYCRDCPYNGVA